MADRRRGGGAYLELLCGCVFLVWSLLIVFRRRKEWERNRNSDT